MAFLYNDNRLKTRRQALRNNMPKPEQRLWYWLRGKKANGYKFRRQYGVGGYILDFYCPELRLGIELDGDSHFNDKAKEYDRIREDFLKANNIRVLRFTNKEVKDNIQGVVEKLLKYLPDSP
jgi:very-short-patch-repair endonuclease